MVNMRIDNEDDQLYQSGASEHLDVSSSSGWSFCQARALLCLKVDSHIRGNHDYRNPHDHDYSRVMKVLIYQGLRLKRFSK